MSPSSKRKMAPPPPPPQDDHTRSDDPNSDPDSDSDADDDEAIIVSVVGEDVGRVGEATTRRRRRRSSLAAAAQGSVGGGAVVEGSGSGSTGAGAAAAAAPSTSTSASGRKNTATTTTAAAAVKNATPTKAATTATTTNTSAAGASRPPRPSTSNNSTGPGTATASSSSAAAVVVAESTPDSTTTTTPTPTTRSAVTPEATTTAAATAARVGQAQNSGARFRHNNPQQVAQLEMQRRDREAQQKHKEEEKLQEQQEQEWEKEEQQGSEKRQQLEREKQEREKQEQEKQERAKLECQQLEREKIKRERQQPEQQQREKELSEKQQREKGQREKQEEQQLAQRQQQQREQEQKREQQQSKQQQREEQQREQRSWAQHHQGQARDHSFREQQQRQHAMMSGPPGAPPMVIGHPATAGGDFTPGEHGPSVLVPLRGFAPMMPMAGQPPRPPPAASAVATPPSTSVPASPAPVPSAPPRTHSTSASSAVPPPSQPSSAARRSSTPTLSASATGPATAAASGQSQPEQNAKAPTSSSNARPAPPAPATPGPVSTTPIPPVTASTASAASIAATPAQAPRPTGPASNAPRQPAAARTTPPAVSATVPVAAAPAPPAMPISASSAPAVQGPVSSRPASAVSPAMLPASAASALPIAPGSSTLALALSTTTAPSPSAPAPILPKASTFAPSPSAASGVAPMVATAASSPPVPSAPAHMTPAPAVPVVNAPSTSAAPAESSSSTSPSTSTARPASRKVVFDDSKKADKDHDMELGSVSGSGPNSDGEGDSDSENGRGSSDGSSATPILSTTSAASLAYPRAGQYDRISQQVPAANTASETDVQAVDMAKDRKQSEDQQQLAGSDTGTKSTTEQQRASSSTSGAAAAAAAATPMDVDVSPAPPPSKRPGRKGSSRKISAATSASASPAPRDGDDSMLGEGEELLASDGTPLSQLRGESRGRKKMEGLPPSRAREVQRAFRARRAAHLATLENRILELEAENTELRRLLALPLKERHELGSGPTGRGKSLKEGGVPMSERVRAKRERDRLRHEAAARAAAEAKGIEYVPPSKPVYSEDDEIALNVSPAAGSSVNHRGLTESPGLDDDASNRRQRRASKSAERPQRARQPSLAISDGGSSITSSLFAALTEAAGVEAAKPREQTTQPPTSGVASTSDTGSQPVAGPSTAAAAAKTDDLDYSALESWLQSAAGEQNTAPAVTLDFPAYTSGFQQPSSSNFSNAPLYQQQQQQQQQQQPHQQVPSNPPWMPNNAPHPPAAAFADNNAVKALFMAALQAEQHNPGALQAFANAAMSAAQNQSGNPPADERSDQPDPGQAAVMANIERMIKAAGATQAAQNGFRMPPIPRQLQQQQQEQQQQQYMRAQMQQTPAQSYQQDLFAQLAAAGLTGPSRGNNHYMQQAQPASSLPPYLASLTAGVLSPNFPDGHPPNRFMPNAWNQQQQQFSAFSPFGAATAPSPMNFDFASMGFPMAGPSSSSSPRQNSMTPATQRQQGGMPTSASSPMSVNQLGKRKERPDSADSAATLPQQERPTNKPALLQRLRDCCHLSDVHVTNDPGILFFASKLCGLVACRYNGRHAGRIIDLDNEAEKRRRTGALGQSAAGEPTVEELQERYMDVEPAWQLLKSHLEPSIDGGSWGGGFEGLSGGAAVLAQLERAAKATDSQNQITGTRAGEMITSAVLAKVKSGQSAEDWISCRRAPGLIIRKHLITELIGGF